MAKSTNINNRRYLGNKYKLLPFIKKVVDSECTDIEIVVDIFSGTGAVASAFQDKQLITNDILYSNYISNFAWFSPRKYSRKKIETIIDEYNAMVINEENYMTINFSNTYFSHDDCSKIGYIREDIETKYANKEINERERALLITSLLYAMDKIAKTYLIYILNHARNTFIRCRLTGRTISRCFIILVYWMKPFAKSRKCYLNMQSIIRIRRCI